MIHASEYNRIKVLILILLEVTQIALQNQFVIGGVVLILILLEVTQIGNSPGCYSRRQVRLNPYSTGSNSNNLPINVKIHSGSLNPYSTGSNSNNDERTVGFGVKKCLNPYSTGSNSNLPVLGLMLSCSIVLILILLEVTQIPFASNAEPTTFVLILILLEVTQIMYQRLLVRIHGMS